MLKTLKYFLSRVYTIISIVLFALSYGAIQAYAVYYPTDNITNPTCAPGDSGCYVSLNTLDQNIRIWNATGHDMTSVGIGTLALDTITGTDNYNYAIGEESMRYATGSGNYGFGWYTLRGDGINTNNGSRNIGIGEGVLNKLRSGSDNIGIGNASFNSLTTGSFNISIGRSSQRFLTTGSSNTSLGYGSLINNIIGSGNATFGYNSATSATGSYNTIIGYGGGQSLSTGSYNIAIGQNVDLPSNTASGQLNIGNIIYGTGIYSGASASSTPVTIGMVGVGTSTPTATLDVLYDSTTDERMTFGGAGRLNIIRYGSDQALRIQRANGTSASQTHVLLGENIGQFGFEGYRANASFGRTFDISIQASEDYLGSSYGSTASFFKVKTGGSSRYAYMYTDGNNRTGFTSGSSSLSGIIPSTLYVLGEGSTSSTYTAQFHNSTGTNNALVIRDDGKIGIGTGSPEYELHLVSNTSVNFVGDRYSSDTTAIVFRGRKSRGTLSSPLAVNGGDSLVMFDANGYDGTSFVRGASILFTANSTFNGLNRGTNITFSTVQDSSTSNYERMRISHNGNIGIGTTSPSANLHIEPSLGTGEVWQWIKNSRDTSSVASLYVENNSGINIALKSYGSTNASTIFGVAAANTMSIMAGGANNGLFIGHSGNSKPIIFGQGSTENMRIAASTGNVGIAVSSPISRLSNSTTNIVDFASSRNVDDLGIVWKIASTGAKYVAGFENTTNSTGAGGVVIRTVNTNGGTYLLQLVANSTEVASFTGDGNAFKPGGGSFTATSDQRAKKDIVDLNLGLSAINSLKPVTFKYNGMYPTAPDNGKTYVGLIAQDVIGTQLEQYLVSTDESTGMYRLDPSAIPFALVGAIKELDIKVNQQASLDTTLEGSFGYLAKELLSNASNSIVDLYVKVIHSDRVETKELCTSSGNCLNEDELNILIQEFKNNHSVQQPQVVNIDNDLSEEIIPTPTTEPIIEEIVQEDIVE